MKCIKCGGEIPENAKFCPLCGQNNSNTPSFCMYCGSPVTDDMQFCENCGKPIERLAQEEEKEETEMPELPKKEEVEEAVNTVTEAQNVMQPEAPVQPQSAQAPVQAPAPVRAAAPAATQLPVASAAASVGAQLGTQAVKTAGEVAAKSVSSAGKVAKTVAIWAAIVAFVIGAATACLNFFVPAPEDTVNKLIEAVEELNYDDMLSCFDSDTEKQIRAVMGISGDLLGSLTGISIDLEDMMALAPSLAPYMEIPDLGIAKAETVLYADCSASKLLEYCETANSGGAIPTGYLSDNSIISFLEKYSLTLPGLENLIAEAAIVKITLKSGEVGYLPLINEGNGDWRIPMMDLVGSLEGEY